MQRRVDLLAAEGVLFRTGVEVGKDINVKELHASHDAVLLTVGATWPRDLPIPNRQLDGIHFAMDFLTPTTKVRRPVDQAVSGYRTHSIVSAGKFVLCCHHRSCIFCKACLRCGLVLTPWPVLTNGRNRCYLCTGATGQGQGHGRFPNQC